jgi:hypothetical protein
MILNKDPTKRFPGSYEKIKSNEIFKDFKWVFLTIYIKLEKTN